MYLRLVPLLGTITLFAVICALLVWLQKDLSQKITSLETNIHEQSERSDRTRDIDQVIEIQTIQMKKIESMDSALESQGITIGKIADIEAAITEQRDILNIALGGVLPIHMPPEWEQRLKKLQDQLSDPALWPTSEIKAGQFMEELSELVSELSPLAEAEYFNELSRLRWAALAFDGLYGEFDTNATDYDRADRLRSIANATPRGFDTNLEDKLRRQAEELVIQADENAINQMIDQARHYLADPIPEQHDTTEINSIFEEIYDSLRYYKDHAFRNRELEDIRSLLRLRMSERDAKDQANVLTTRWARIEDLAESNASVFETVANVLLSDAAIARARIAQLGIDTSDYDDLMVNIRRTVHGIQDKAKRKYQEWALNQTITFASQYKKIMKRSEKMGESENENTNTFDDKGLRSKLAAIENWLDGVPVDAKGLGDEIRQRVKGGIFGQCIDEGCRKVQNAIIDHLLPIDEKLLDLAVLKRYRREFDEGWSSLTGRNEQTCVAVAASLVSKKTFGDLGDYKPGSGIGEHSQLWRDSGCEQ